jgi:hypothetical protein
VTNNHATSAIRTRNPSNRTAEDLSFIPHGHRDLLIESYKERILHMTKSAIMKIPGVSAGKEILSYT